MTCRNLCRFAPISDNVMDQKTTFDPSCAQNRLDIGNGVVGTGSLLVQNVLSKRELRSHHDAHAVTTAVQ